MRQRCRPQAEEVGDWELDTDEEEDHVEPEDEKKKNDRNMPQ